MKVTVTQTISDLLEVRRIENKVSIMPFDVGLGAVLLSTVDAKGDLIVGTASDTVSRLPKGTDGYILLADSNEPTGLKWGAQQGGATFSMTNNDSVTHDVGTLVYLDTSGDSLVKRTTVAGDPKILAIAKESVPAGSSGVYAQTGKLTVLVQGNVAVGQWLTASATAGRAQASSYSKPTSGAIGIAVTAYSGGGAGSVEVLCDIDWKSATPLQQLTTTTLNTSTGTSITVSHVADPGTDLLVVRVLNNNASAPSSITYNGVGLTKLDDQSGANYNASIWYLKNPSIGTYNLVITHGSSSTHDVCVTNYAGTQSSPFRTALKATGSGTSASLSPTSSTGDLVIDNLGANISGWTITQSQTTEVVNRNLVSSMYHHTSKKDGGSGSTAMGYSGGSTTYFIQSVAIAGS